jgi:hypothetical protein
MNARAEVDAISAPLGQQIVNRGTISDLPGVSDLMLSRDLPSIIHFAGHITFSNEAGPSISLEGGLWEPSDLALAVVRTSLAQVHPLVFLNACRSAGEIPWVFPNERMGHQSLSRLVRARSRFVVGCAVKLRRELRRGLLRTVGVQWPVTGQRVACRPHRRVAGGRRPNVVGLQRLRQRSPRTTSAPLRTTRKPPAAGQAARPRYAGPATPGSTASHSAPGRPACRGCLDVIHSEAKPHPALSQRPGSAAAAGAWSPGTPLARDRRSRSVRGRSEVEAGDLGIVQQRLAGPGERHPAGLEHGGLVGDREP